MLVLTMGNAALSQPSDSLKQSFLQFKTQLDSAVNYADKEQLIKARYGFQDLASNNNLKVLATYYLGYADYRLSSIFEDMSDNQKEKYLDSAIKYLQNVTEMDPRFAEGWALLGNCYGMKATGIFSGMKYGPKSEKAINKAMSLSPENPRVVMLNGIGLMHKPSMFGGSVEKAIQEFKEATGLYKEQNPTTEMHPDWGEAENYAWMAQAYINQDKLQQARQAYQSALQVNPDYYWVKEILLPELNQQMD